MAAPIPFRGQWNRRQAEVQADVQRPGFRGAYARGMLALMNPFIRWIAKERGADGPENNIVRKAIEPHVVVATTGICAQMLFNVIMEASEPDKIALRDRVLDQLRHKLGVELARRTTKNLIIPPPFGL